jgi:hypothetical protein
MKTVMVQLHIHNASPKIEDIARLLTIHVDQIDPEFGIIETDPADHLYTIMVDEAETATIEKIIAKRKAHPAEGIFSNPRIEPM